MIMLHVRNSDFNPCHKDYFKEIKGYSQSSIQLLEYNKNIPFFLFLSLISLREKMPAKEMTHHRDDIHVIVSKTIYNKETFRLKSSIIHVICVISYSSDVIQVFTRLLDQ